jgi:SAM-dependent methyltransferase
MKFDDIRDLKNIYLYCGDMPINRRILTNKAFIGLSLSNDNANHIKHDITRPFNIKTDSVDIIQSEDVMEHIEYSKLPTVINEIYRILKPNGLFRLSMPTYECDVLYNRSSKDLNGNIIFDIGGGGLYDKYNKKVINEGHVWFPTFKLVNKLLDSTNFQKQSIHYLHYYDENGTPVMNNIDYSNGYIARTPDNDLRVQNPRRPMSIVVDCYKTI